VLTNLPANRVQWGTPNGHWLRLFCGAAQAGSQNHHVLTKTDHIANTKANSSTNKAYLTKPPHKHGQFLSTTSRTTPQNETTTTRRTHFSQRIDIWPGQTRTFELDVQTDDWEHWSCILQELCGDPFNGEYYDLRAITELFPSIDEACDAMDKRLAHGARRKLEAEQQKGLKG
jgi:hypothetical protein